MVGVCLYVGIFCYRRLSLLLFGFVLGVSMDFGNLKILGEFFMFFFCVLFVFLL